VSYKDYEVLSVIKPAPDAVIGVNMGGDQGYRTFDLTGMAIQPQEGDNVRIDLDGMPGKSTPFVVRYLTPGRTWFPPQPDPVVLTVANSAPSDPDYSAGSVVYAKPGAIWVARSSPVTPPADTSGSMTVRAAGSRTWDPSNGWRSDDTKPRQGSFGSGTNKGLWFYPSGAFGGLSGRSGVTATLTVTRDSRGGTPWSPKQLVVWSHGYVTQPGGEPVISNSSTPGGANPGINDTVTFALPGPIVAAFVAGTAVGVAIGSEQESDYLICLGPDQDPNSGTLRFRWNS
jgi:hypothetical protein